MEPRPAEGSYSIYPYNTTVDVLSITLNTVGQSVLHFFSDILLCKIWYILIYSNSICNYESTAVHLHHLGLQVLITLQCTAHYQWTTSNSAVPNWYWISGYETVLIKLLPSIETCFNCFGNRSSNAKEIIKRQQNHPGNSTVMQPLLTPPPQLLGGERGVAKMAPVPEGEIFSPTTPTLGVKNFIIY